jgi:hypothetical protein
VYADRYIAQSYTDIAQRSLGRTLFALHNFQDAELQLSWAYSVYRTEEHPSTADIEELSRDLAKAHASEPAGNRASGVAALVQ